jgi:hypothetical protein
MTETNPIEDGRHLAGVGGERSEVVLCRLPVQKVSLVGYISHTVRRTGGTHGLTEDLSRASGGTDESERKPDGSGLAGPVPAEQADKFTRFDIEGEWPKLATGEANTQAFSL